MRIVTDAGELDRDSTAVSGPVRPLRVALYSHDSTGLGHVRRNLLVAEALSDDGHDILLLTGSPEAASMPRPPRVDLVTLPALSKEPDGAYRARHLAVALDELLVLRRELLRTALSTFGPDVLIVDRHARGFLRELEPALSQLHGAHVVLGLRDVLDDVAEVRREWRDHSTPAALSRWYDEVWLYGDARLYHPLDAAGLRAPVPVAALGYLDRGVSDEAVAVPLPDRPFILCTVGGGADGAAVASAVLDADLPAGHNLRIVTGPQLPVDVARDLRARAAERPGRHVETFVHDVPRLLQAAAAAVIMGGYNTVSEALSTSTPVLVVPRDAPRREQRIRADVLAAAGLIDAAPVAPPMSDAIAGWVADAVGRRYHPRAGVDRRGLDHVRARLRVVAASRASKPQAVVTQVSPQQPKERSHVAV